MRDRLILTLAVAVVSCSTVVAHAQTPAAAPVITGGGGAGTGGIGSRVGNPTGGIRGTTQAGTGGVNQGSGTGGIRDTTQAGTGGIQ